MIGNGEASVGSEWNPKHGTRVHQPRQLPLEKEDQWLARLLFPILFLLIAARIPSAPAPARRAHPAAAVPPARAPPARRPATAPPPAAAPPEDGQWALPAKDYASTRFSGLD